MILSLRLDSWSRADRIYTSRILSVCVEALAQVDALCMARHRPPAIYRSGVEYRREPRGVEQWRDIPAVLAEGCGDCEDLSAWRIAELRALGVQAMPSITWRVRDDGGTSYHVRVVASGILEDPSLVLLGRARPTLPLP